MTRSAYHLEFFTKRRGGFENARLAVDQFGQPSRLIFLVKFNSSGTVVWHKIWNGTTVIGLGRTGVALEASGSFVYVTGSAPITATTPL